jgi:TM2 domain-containing membrane protein YozV
MNGRSGLSADTQALMAFESGKKSGGLAYLLWFFTGGVGGHRFYLGRTGSAVAQLILAVLGWPLLFAAGFGLVFLIPLGIWLLIDVFTLGGMVAKHNAALMERLNRTALSPVDELSKFAALRDSGAISADEYDAQKQRLIGAPAGSTPQ